MQLQVRTLPGTHQFVLQVLILDDQLVSLLIAEGQVEALVVSIVVQHLHLTAAQSESFHRRTLLEIVELNSSITDLRVEPDEVGVQQIKATDEVWRGKQKAVRNGTMMCSSFTVPLTVVLDEHEGANGLVGSVGSVNEGTFELTFAGSLRGAAQKAEQL